MKIALLGGHGFIGYWLAKTLPGHGFEVIEVPAFRWGLTSDKQTDVPGLLEDFLQKHQPQIVINCLGSASVPASFEDPQKDFASNLIIPKLVLEQIRRFSTKTHFVHISSAAVYGNPAKLPVDEAAKMAPLSPYGWNKYLSEVLVKSYSELYGMPTTVLRPFSVYGPRLKKQIFWDLSQRLRSLTAGEPLMLKGFGSDSRDYIFITDFCEAVALILKSQKPGYQVYNIANGHEVSIQQAAIDLVSGFGRNTAIMFDQKNLSGAPARWVANIGKLRDLGYSPKVTLKEGLQQYAKWYESHHATV